MSSGHYLKINWYKSPFEQLFKTIFFCYWCNSQCVNGLYPHVCGWNTIFNNIIFQLYHGNQFYWRKLEEITDLLQATDKNLSHKIVPSTSYKPGIRTHISSFDSHSPIVRSCGIAGSMNFVYSHTISINFHCHNVNLLPRYPDILLQHWTRNLFEHYFLSLNKTRTTQSVAYPLA